MRYSLKPLVFKEKESVSKGETTTEFFQVEPDFYFDSYLSVTKEKRTVSKGTDVRLNIYARTLRRLNFVNKGKISPDESYKNTIRKAGFSTQAEFSLLKGKPLDNTTFESKQNIADFVGMIYSMEGLGYKVFDQQSGITAVTDQQAYGFFDELLQKVKHAMPQDFVYYDNPLAPDFEVEKMYIFHKAFEEVNSFLKYPNYSFLLVKDKKQAGRYFVIFRIIQ